MDSFSSIEMSNIDPQSTEEINSPIIIDSAECNICADIHEISDKTLVQGEETNGKRKAIHFADEPYNSSEVAIISNRSSRLSMRGSTGKTKSASQNPRSTSRRSNSSRSSRSSSQRNRSSSRRRKTSPRSSTRKAPKARRSKKA